MLKQQSVFLAVYLLYSLTNIVKSPNDLPDKVISVNNLRGIFEESGGNIGILLPHITDKVLNPFAAFCIPLFEVFDEILLTSFGKNIKYTPGCRVCNNALIFDITGIALKLVNGKDARKLAWLWESHNIEDTNHRRNRQIDAFGDRCERVFGFQFINNVSDKTIGHTMIPWKKGNILVKALAAIWAYIPAFPNNDSCRFTKGGNVLDTLLSVIMDFIGRGVTTGAVVRFAWHLSKNSRRILVLSHIFYDKVLQTNQFFGIMEVEYNEISL